MTLLLVDVNDDLLILLRSDATLNPGGVRIGASEIYFALDTINQVVGAVAVGWKTPEEQHESIVLLVQLSDDQTKVIIDIEALKRLSLILRLE